jgi:restriction system protein
MLHKFYHEVKPGDVVIARRGLKKLVAVGTVKRGAYYDLDKHSIPGESEYGYPNHLDIEWKEAPRNKELAAGQQFAMNTIYEIDEERFCKFTGKDGQEWSSSVADGVQDQDEFVLEKYLQEFIVSNFDAIFKKKLVLVSEGQQYHTDVGIIDILAQDPRRNDAFVVIELKKGRGADQVVGQILRYMGWVTENLCSDEQEVYGIIICKEFDDKLRLALKMVKNLSVKCYWIDFKLQDQS